jgi:hypothetical protein
MMIGLPEGSSNTYNGRTPKTFRWAAHRGSRHVAASARAKKAVALENKRTNQDCG